jgi:hypothetical protein
MEVTLKSTTMIVNLNGVPTRVWEGVTAKGVPVHAFIVRVACALDADAAEFEADLNECDRPSPAVEAIPSNMVL